MQNENIDLDFTLPSTSPGVKVVPNKFPTVKSEFPIAIIGEAPGAHEVQMGEPFVGPSGRLLDALLARNNILRSSCFLGNVCQHRPPGNDIEAFDWNSPEIQEGLTKIRQDLEAFKPNLVVCLGGTALRAFVGEVRSIKNWRGSLFWSDWGYKCLAAYHPAFCLRLEEGVPLLNFDLKKASTQRQTQAFVLPQRSFLLDLSADEIIDRLAQMQASGKDVSLDIEGYVGDMPCLSFTTDPMGGLIVPFAREQGRNYWGTVEEEAKVWLAVKRICEDTYCPKVLQNGLYDRFILFWDHGILVRNFKFDTMLMHWEKYCELPKGLGLQASIYTNEPYYKGDRHAQTVKQFHIYCCKDSAVTLEIKQRVLPTLNASEKRSFEFGMGMQDPLLYMEVRGMRFDSSLRAQKTETLQTEIDLYNDLITASVGAPLNVKSTKQKAAYLYDNLGLEKKYNRKTKAVTTNYEAILSLSKANPDKEELKHIIKTTSLRTRLSALQMKVDKDGRVRCSYNSLSKKEGKADTGGPTSTGRLSCQTSATGSGTNLQTIPDYDRDLFQADEGYEMFQCDLSGADTWTVAAHCKRLGDPTMMDDLLAGIKIAKILVLGMKNPSIISLPREVLAELSKSVPKDDPNYFGAKCCVHGSNYGMGKVLMSQTIFIESEGEVNLPASVCEKLQQLYFRRYPGVPTWHRWVASELRSKRQLVSASGHTRRFFGNPAEHSTLKAALADEPQNNTTYATNLAAYRLWNDPENLRPDGSLIIEPLHQVHDALVGQWPVEVRDWAKAKVRSYFQNTLTIAGQSIIIPFSGQFGKNWKEAGDETNLNRI